MIYKFLNHFSSQGNPFGARIKLIGLIPPSHSQIILTERRKKKKTETKERERWMMVYQL